MTPEDRLKTILDSLEGKVRSGLDRSRRLFHGRGRTCPGLEYITIDWFDPVILVTLFSVEGEALLTGLVEGVRSIFGERLGALLVQRRYLEDTPFELLHGDLPQEVFSVEDGLRYLLRFEKTQNVGFFLDMSGGRALVRELSRGRKVLNLFSYTCSFSVAALAGGADHVVNLDMSRWALLTGKTNHEINGLDLRKVSFLAHDLFKSFGKLKKVGPYGVIVIDPPTEQGKSFSAKRDWPRIVRKVMGLAEPGCDILACLNAPHIAPSYLEDLFKELFAEARHIDTLGPGEDFPEVDEARGLNILHFRTPGKNS